MSLFFSLFSSPFSHTSPFPSSPTLAPNSPYPVFLVRFFFSSFFYTQQKYDSVIFWVENHYRIILPLCVSFCFCFGKHHKWKYDFIMILNPKHNKITLSLCYFFFVLENNKNETMISLYYWMNSTMESYFYYCIFFKTEKNPQQKYDSNVLLDE